MIIIPINLILLALVKFVLRTVIISSLFQISMSRYIPVRTTMDSEDHYHSPYDTHELDSDQHYEAPTCLKRNPSGSLFIPSGVLSQRRESI